MTAVPNKCRQRCPRTRTEMQLLAGHGPAWQPGRWLLLLSPPRHLQALSQAGFSPPWPTCLVEDEGWRSSHLLARSPGRRLMCTGKCTPAKATRHQQAAPKLQALSHHPAKTAQGELGGWWPRLYALLEASVSTIVQEKSPCRTSRVPLNAAANQRGSL